MIPGTVSKLSEEIIAAAATISPLSDQIIVTGTTSIATIVVAPGVASIASQMLIIIPKDGNVATLTTGNITTAVTMAQNRATVLHYSKSQSTWYVGAIGGAT